MYAVLLIFLLILLMAFKHFSINFVLFADDGFFVIPEDEFFNPEDYDQKSALSPEGEMIVWMSFFSFDPIAMANLFLVPIRLLIYIYLYL